MQSARSDRAAPLSERPTTETLSPWWRRLSLLTIALGFAVLVLLTFKVYHEAPPIAARLITPDGFAFVFAFVKTPYSVTLGIT